MVNSILYGVFSIGSTYFNEYLAMTSEAAFARVIEYLKFPLSLWTKDRPDRLNARSGSGSN